MSKQTNYLLIYFKNQNYIKYFLIVKFIKTNLIKYEFKL